MIATKLKALLFVAFSTGCGNVAEGQSGRNDTVRVAIGMPVAELNAQPAVARQPGRLDPRDSGVFVMAANHRLILELNGHQISFETGGGRAPTYVTSGYYIEDSLEGKDRIGSVDITTTPERVTLEDVLALARDRCASLRAAGLSPRRLDPRYAIISESLGGGTGRMLANEAEVIAALTDTQMRVRSLALCELEDPTHSFALSITNTRRAYYAGSGGGSEEDVLTEQAYIMTVHFSQNLSETSGGSPQNK
jgi:hypothetical protein